MCTALHGTPPATILLTSRCQREASRPRAALPRRATSSCRETSRVQHPTTRAAAAAGTKTKGIYGEPSLYIYIPSMHHPRCRRPKQIHHYNHVRYQVDADTSTVDAANYESLAMSLVLHSLRTIKVNTSISSYRIYGSIYGNIDQCIISRSRGVRDARGRCSVGKGTV